MCHGFAKDFCHFFITNKFSKLCYHQVFSLYGNLANFMSLKLTLIKLLSLRVELCTYLINILFYVKELEILMNRE